MKTAAVLRTAGLGLAMLALVGWSARAARAEMYQAHGHITPADPHVGDAWHYDAYPIFLEAGQHLHVDMMSYDVDSYVILVDPQGAIVAQDDDGGWGMNASLHFTAPRAGTYQIIAKTCCPHEYGHYDLVVELLAAPNPLPQGQTPAGQYPPSQMPAGQGQYPPSQAPAGQGQYPPSQMPAGQGQYPPSQAGQGQSAPSQFSPQQGSCCCGHCCCH